MSKLFTGQAFLPIIGKCYEVHYGEIVIDNETGFGIARVRIEGTNNGTS